MRPKKTSCPPYRPVAVPRTYAAAATSAGREEHPPATIAAHAAESTQDDEWVKRTPAAALIIPPPPQFADRDDPTTCQDTAVPADPSPCPAIPHLVVEFFPSWIRHFATIAGALGHAPNAKPYRRGVVFSPKSASELAIVERTMRVAASEDSAISWSRDYRDIRCILRRKQRRPNNAAAKTQVHRVHHARPPAEAAPREAPVDAPAATAIPDAPIPVATASPDAPTPDATDILDAPTPAATATPDAPTPAPRKTAAHVPDAPITLDAPTPTDSKTAHHRERRRRRKRAPRPPRADTAWKQTNPRNCLDNMVQAIIKILTTGMAAYLHEKGAMPVYQKQPRVHSQVIWRTRAGERPAQNTHRGTEFPCARPE